MSKQSLILALAFSTLLCPTVLAGPAPASPEIETLERLSRQGKTLGDQVTARYPLERQRVRDDTGINVLIDLAHQATFVAMWELPRLLRGKGFRASGSQASLDTVLAPGKKSRLRIPVGGRRPFAWWPNERFHAVITFQSDPRSQDYLPGERRALKAFVRSGGGLIVVAGNVLERERIEGWTLNRLMSDFGAGLSPEPDRADGRTAPTLKLGREWEVQKRGEKGRPVLARREYGKGRVVVFSSTRLFFWNKNAAGDAPDSRESRGREISEALKWAAAGATSTGGTLRLPREAAGGGPIYPELEQNVGGVIVYYAKNQKEELLRAVRKEMPGAKKQIEEWLPSRPPDEPMYLIVSAGGGGGWAVNAYRPKETGVISLSRHGLLSVFGHELAHTMGGPPNEKGELAASWPQGNQGESHAGWFQGKINALFDEEQRNRANRDCNSFFRFDKNGGALDLALNPREMNEKWGKGKEWTKIWWVWQKLDDRYGPTWYPRWRWVQYTRWKDDPGRRLTWDETVEDMSIAVGEDLFPFFKKIGTTLKKDRFESAGFQGKKIELPVAPLEVTPAGPVRLEAIGDYRKPLIPR